VTPESSPRRADAVNTIVQSRETRLIELTDAAHREKIVADALDALAKVIADAPIPVSQYTPVWQAVEKRIRLDAAQARKRAALATERLEDVQGAIVARERFIGAP